MLVELGSDEGERATQPEVYICVVNWNSGNHILACLESLARLDYTNFTVSVVDNSSTDGSAQRIQQTFPWVRLLVSQTNCGYAGGNALALPDAVESQAVLFWIVNPDAVVESDTLRQLVDAFERNGEALYGSVPLFRENPRAAWQVSMRSWAVDSDGQPNLNRRVTLKGDYKVIFGDNRERLIASLSGASLLIPLKVISKYGFMDLDFFLYAEETDYSLHLARYGIRSFLVPASIVYHDTQGAHKYHRQLKPVVIYYQTRNRLIVVRRYGSPYLYAQVLVRTFFNVLAWVAIAPVVGGDSIKIAAYTLLAIWHALRSKLGATFLPRIP